ncbi:MAG: SCO family protein [Candidatus Thiodiazotropha sp.]
MFNELHYRIASAFLFVVSVLLFVLIPFVESPFQEFDFYGRNITGKAPTFSLTDTQGEIRTLGDFRGRFVYLMFGYLGCVDVCHSQALSFYMLNRSIETDSVQFLYLGMDPENDTASKIDSYFDSRGTNFTGLLAQNIAHAQAIAGDYNAYFSIEPSNDYANRRINHPGYIYLIDPDGNLRLLYSGTNLQIGRMIDDLNQIATDFF